MLSSGFGPIPSLFDVIPKTRMEYRRQEEQEELEASQ